MQKQPKNIVLPSFQVCKHLKTGHLHNMHSITGQNTQHCLLFDCLNFVLQVLKLFSAIFQKISVPAQNIFGPVAGTGPGGWEALC